MRTSAAVVVVAAILLGTSAPVFGAQAGISVASITGAYRDRFEDGDVHGRTFLAENNLEIVRRSRHQAYVAISLVFLNGHTCRASGIVDVHGPSLVYDSYRMRDGSRCVLILRVTRDRIAFDDRDNLCRQELCSAGGSFSGVDFNRALRHPIGDGTRLLSSPEYSRALAEYRMAHAL